MKLFEYQAKSCFTEFGIDIPKGILAATPDMAAEAAAEIGFPCVIKSQILRGGRGNLGLVKIASGEEDAVAIVASLFGSRYGVGKLLIESCVDFDKEYYLSFSIDPVRAQAVAMLCANGGVEIETIAKETPEKIVRAYVDIAEGITKKAAMDLAVRGGLRGDVAERFSEMVLNLYACFVKYDAELAEINPVFLTRDGSIVAGDGKLIIDDNSAHRQSRYERTREHFNSDMEYEASLHGIPYIQFDGEISLMCAGAGLTTTVYDLINYEGGTIANYLEFGGPNYTKSETAMQLCLRNESTVILIVTFGTIARADVIAEGIVKACAKLRPDRPLVTCIRGTNEEEASRILYEADIECYAETEDAVKRAIKLAAEGRQGK